jgi:hypothetical protein
MTQLARIQQKEKMSERAAVEPGLAAGGHLAGGRRKESRGAFPRLIGLLCRLVRGFSEVSLYTVGCMERAGCSCSVGCQRGAGRPAPTRKAVTSLAKRLEVTVPP